MTPSLDEIAAFAEEEVFSTLSERYSAAVFSRELWKRMGDLGLLGMTVDGRYGGSGGSPAELAEAVRLLTKDGRDLGTTLSLVTHLALCAKSIELYGTEEQKKKYLPRLASGELVGAAAVSEAGSGAHPGGIETTAVEESGGYVLDGQKLYTTDGPVADLLVVMASTGRGEDGRNELTAFLVETSLEGFEAERMELDFLMTSPHGQLTFENMHIPADSVLGVVGEGHSALSRTAFARERAMVLAAVSGLFAAEANEVADRYRQMHEGMDMEGRTAGAWIHHLSAIDAYDLISRELVEASFEQGERWKESIDLLIYMGLSYGKWVYWIEDFASSMRVPVTFPLDVMFNDSRLVMVNEGLLTRLGRKRFLK